MRRPRSRDGFTILEVMLAIAVMLVGIMGVLSLERAVLHANYDARASAIATSNTARWVAILRASATRWVEADDLSNAPYLSHLGEGWWIPTPTGIELEPFAVDWYGVPTSVVADARFCTLLRVVSLSDQRSVRADVITFWPRQSARAAHSGSLAFVDLCADGAGADAAAALSADDARTPLADTRFHHLRTTIVLRKARP